MRRAWPRGRKHRFGGTAMNSERQFWFDPGRGFGPAVMGIVVVAILLLSGTPPARGVVVTEFTPPTGGSSPQEITVGPDGALWFTQLGSNQIGRITTGGVITEFAIPSANSGPRGITTGPDGALW